MTTKAAAAKKDEKSEEKAPDPIVETRVSFDGLRAVDTIDGVQGDAREATFAEQVAALASLVGEQAVGIIHNAASASVETSGNVITITLEPR